MKERTIPYAFVTGPKVYTRPRVRAILYQRDQLDLDFVHTIPAHFENGEKVTDRPPAQTKAAQFCPADFEHGRF